MNWAELLLCILGAIVAFLVVAAAVCVFIGWLLEKWNYTHPRSFLAGQRSVRSDLHRVAYWFSEWWEIEELIHDLGDDKAITAVRDTYRKNREAVTEEATP